MRWGDTENSRYKWIPKGTRQILVERSVDVRGMKADDMRKALKEMHDFKYKKTKVETLHLDITDVYLFPNT